MTPAVSILIPSHRPEFLAEAIASVQAQTRTDWELLVAYEPGAPLNERLNNIAMAARGEYLCVLADDDLLHPNFLSMLLAYDTDVIYSDVRCFGYGGEQMARMPAWMAESFARGPACWLTSLVRRRVWQELGGHEPSLSYHDWDFWLRAFKSGATATHVAWPYWSHREHEGQWTHKVRRPDALAQMQARHPELTLT